VQGAVSGTVSITENGVNMSETLSGTVTFN
jgi:hypothetical protein